MSVRIDERSCDYSMSEDHAKSLAGIILLNLELRRLALAKIAKIEGPDAIVEMFAQFIGMANSVLSNSHDFLEIAGIVEAGLTDRQAGQINFPTHFGALMGVGLAKYGCEKMCAGCAFRLGSHANQSPATTSDADWCGHPGEQAFMCHEDLDEGGPTKICAGWLRLRQDRKKAA